MNKRETSVYDTFKSEGWEILKKGWPDFLLHKNGKVVLIEVKRKQKRPTIKGGLSVTQRRMKEILGTHLPYHVIYVD